MTHYDGSKCCVESCMSTSNLSRWPRNHALAEIWVKLLLPHCPSLHNYKSRRGRIFLYVCFLHFEKKYLHSSGRRQNMAIPTLFTKKEMATGQPRMPVLIDVVEDDAFVSVEHSYTQTKQYILKVGGENHKDASTENTTYFSCRPKIFEDDGVPHARILLDEELSSFPCFPIHENESTVNATTQYDKSSQNRALENANDIERSQLRITGSCDNTVLTEDQGANIDGITVDFFTEPNNLQTNESSNILGKCSSSNKSAIKFEPLSYNKGKFYKTNECKTMLDNKSKAEFSTPTSKASVSQKTEELEEKQITTNYDDYDESDCHREELSVDTEKQNTPFSWQIEDDTIPCVDDDDNPVPQDHIEMFSSEVTSHAAEYWRCMQCKQFITGTVFVCLQCVGCEICMKCETMGTHAEHFVLRAPTEAKYSCVQAMAQAARRVLTDDKEIKIEAEDTIEAEAPVSTEVPMEMEVPMREGNPIETKDPLKSPHSHGTSYITHTQHTAGDNAELSFSSSSEDDYHPQNDSSDTDDSECSLHEYRKKRRRKDSHHTETLIHLSMERGDNEILVSTSVENTKQIDSNKILSSNVENTESKAYLTRERASRVIQTRTVADPSSLHTVKSLTIVPVSSDISCNVPRGVLLTNMQKTRKYIIK